MTAKSCVAGLALLVAAVTLSCRHLMPERSIDYNQGRVAVNLPRDIKNSEMDRDMDKPTAVIVSVDAEGRFFPGKDRAPLTREDLRDKLTELLKDKTAPDTMVYLAASVSAPYGSIVEAGDLIVMKDVSRVGLLVNRVGYNTPSRLAVELQPPPDPNEDVYQLRPNPLTLVASISTDMKVRLNMDPSGSVNDLYPFSERLALIFRQREENYAVKPGFETRTDLPLAERIEKTLTIKAPKSIRYGDVVKVIDAAKGAGANPIILQLYDLAP